jgi:hypothetical protein
MEDKFNILLHCGMYVDANMLEKGIYTSNKPFIYPIDETIETLIIRGRQMVELTGSQFITEKYFDNLKQCTLAPATITLTDN